MLSLKEILQARRNLLQSTPYGVNLRLRGRPLRLIRRSQSTLILSRHGQPKAVIFGRC